MVSPAFSPDPTGTPSPSPTGIYNADFEVRDLATGSVARSIANPRYEPLGSDDSHSYTARHAHRERVRRRSVVRAAFTSSGKLVTVDHQGALRLWK